jgi:hypothetical protein
MSESCAPNRCDLCQIPVDAETFDVSGILENDRLPKESGDHAVLASFQLHPQYCGLLTWFCQFTDAYAFDNRNISTPGLEWALHRNGQPIYPYNAVEAIINPWGYGGQEVAIRLDENATVELRIRNRGFAFDGDPPVRVVAGRILGRYWYNPAFGG